jgi:hypothetical protein
MNAEEELRSGGRYPAYLTTEAVDGPRVPISGERIVVVLGRDELGHALEVSIPLTKRKGDLGKLAVYAIREPLDLGSPWTHFPEVEGTRVGQNVLVLSVTYRPIPGMPVNPREQRADAPDAVVEPELRRDACCSFCEESYGDVGPLVEGPGRIYICAGCIKLCQDIVDQEMRRRGEKRPEEK